MNGTECHEVIAWAGELDPAAAKAYAAMHGVLCAHADDDGQGAHWLAPGVKCSRQATAPGMEAGQ